MFAKSFYEVAVLLWFSRVSSYELVHHARLKVDVPCILFYHFPIISFWEHNGLFLAGCGSWRPDSYYMVSHNILDLEAAVYFVVPVHWCHRWVPPFITVRVWWNGHGFIWDQLGLFLGQSLGHPACIFLDVSWCVHHRRWLWGRFWGCL